MLATTHSRTNRIATALVQRVHQSFVHGRRIRVLAETIGHAMTVPGEWLDVGCGDGGIGRLIMRGKRDVHISGVEAHPRESAAIPVRPFDGLRIDADDGSYDGAMIVDVLHHTTQARALLAEVVRVARRQVVVKDAVADTWIEHKLLAFMDVVGNRPYGVACPFTFLKRTEWSELFESLGFESPRFLRNFRLYPYPFTYLFDGRLHFIAVLDKQGR